MAPVAGRFPQPSGPGIPARGDRVRRQVLRFSGRRAPRRTTRVPWSRSRASSRKPRRQPQVNVPTSPARSCDAKVLTPRPPPPFRPPSPVKAVAMRPSADSKLQLGRLPPRSSCRPRRGLVPGPVTRNEHHPTRCGPPPTLAGEPVLLSIGGRAANLSVSPPRRFEDGTRDSRSRNRAAVTGTAGRACLTGGRPARTGTPWWPAALAEGLAGLEYSLYRHPPAPHRPPPRSRTIVAYGPVGRETLTALRVYEYPG